MIKIRLAKVDDIKGISKVHKEGWLSTYVNEEFNITKEDILSRNFNDKARIQRWMDLIRKQGLESHFWVAEIINKKENKIVAFCIARKLEENNEFVIYILPKFQSQGIGSKLMRKMLVWFGDGKIKIHVVSYNQKAINFYIKHGFKKRGKRGHKLPNGKIMPGFNMIKN